MNVKCEYCGSYMSDTDASCPNCGAANLNMARGANGVPRTIEELKAFAMEKNLPLSKMRFFLGMDMREPKAYGIYKDEDGNFIVYKNKSTGERIVRYKGKDEAYAVNELYQKMRTEVIEEKAQQPQQYRRQTQRRVAPGNYNYGNSSNTYSNKKLTGKRAVLFVILLVVFAVMVSVFAIYSSGFHHHHGGGGWYYDGGYYDDYYYDDYDDYDDYDSYDSYDEWNDDWDDNDWDVGSDWDYGGSDWDSDW